MFCALNGATFTPARDSARHRPVVTTLLPASEVVPATRIPLIVGSLRPGSSARPRGPQRRVHPARGDQLVVRPALDDPPAGHHQTVSADTAWVSRCAIVSDVRPR